MRFNSLLGLLLLSTAAVWAAPVNVRVTVTNLAPTNGTFLTPVWVGFHNGSFDLYNQGQAATPGLEAIAEDGATAPLSGEFNASGNGSVDGTLGGAPFGPTSSVSSTFVLESTSSFSRYFSYASMLVPSNDFFIGNGNPLAFSIFDAAGNFVGANFVVMGSMVLDAGTEVNDEIPMNTAFFGQSTPNTGVTENGTVQLATGFIPGGPILSSAMFSGADFTASGFQVARITVEQVPEPSTFALAGAVVVGMLVIRRKR
jgi:hypothetical protein